MNITLYKTISMIMAIVFGIVGLLFLFASSAILLFFNSISGPLGFEPSLTGQNHFFVILAVSYMYLVTLCALLMNRYPGNPFFPLLLMNGKFASSAVSLGMFLIEKPLLIYLTNAIVDGCIAVVVFIMYRSLKKTLR